MKEQTITYLEERVGRGEETASRGPTEFIYQKETHYKTTTLQCINKLLIPVATITTVQ